MRKTVKRATYGIVLTGACLGLTPIVDAGDTPSMPAHCAQGSAPDNVGWIAAVETTAENYSLQVDGTGLGKQLHSEMGRGPHPHEPLALFVATGNVAVSAAAGSCADYNLPILPLPEATR
ncbi:MAG TPA: hypothetical protein VJ836_01195 [Candidatus Saccharimonadales bacterium]|nr:hypothetical protein [Candidatus Saccharimonadales bacterium]